MARPKNVWPVDLHTVGLDRYQDGSDDVSPLLGLKVAEGPQAGRELILTLTPQGARDLATALTRYADRADTLNAQANPFDPAAAHKEP